MSKRRLAAKNAENERLSGRNDDSVEVLRCGKMSYDEVCCTLRKQKQPQISGLLHRAGSRFFAAPLPDCGTYEGQAITSSFEGTHHELENLPASMLIDPSALLSIPRLR